MSWNSGISVASFSATHESLGTRLGLLLLCTCIQAQEQTNKQTNKQINKQINKQTHIR